MRIPYKDFVTLKFKDFDKLDLPSSTAANVKISTGTIQCPDG